METPAEQVSFNTVSFKQNVKKNSCKKTAKVVRMFSTGEAEKERQIKGAVVPFNLPFNNPGKYSKTESVVWLG